MVAVTDFFSPTTSSTSDTSSIATNTTITNQAVHNLNIPVTPGYRAPREPIVLCHGLYGFDLWGPEAFPSLQLHYWCGIEDALAKLGAKVVVSRVPKAGSIKERAHTLHTVLQQIMHHKKVNFIAHSMGGLDCRYLISHIRQRQYDVQSLSTVCTPHRGSSLMDWFRNHVGVGKNLSDSLLDGALKQNNPMQTHRYWNAHSGSSISALKATMRYEENQPLTLTSSSPGQFWQPAMQKLVQWFDAPAYANLTTDFCKYHFNPNTPDDRRVAYYSYGAAADIPAWSSMLGMPWNYMQKKEGDNDGIVSVQSAKWGQYVKTLEADHWDLSGER
ncbi:Alpha/Beta hydrolase protein [Radiomyces spectabilis]|uniref:Alpha/Beta hydrolase protein n=1 Tax=Radiomyces spectabilis TaxID=64574 RepID=UPI00221FDF20|nr:Alpha/Beta hydrolase protein [Radiomyces spectabilis]KAI8365256.1 Alpha/Beta hydrolase protein [Radiomyces spectabilis]